MNVVRNKEYEEEFQIRARKIVSEMTLEEKVYQTLHSSPAIERLGIKAYNWWNEALHGVARAGVATVFPQAIGLSATFDDEFVEKIADVISTEARAKFNMQQKYDDTDIYKGLTFWSPNVNIFRDPRWGRGHETLGEDPYLTSKLAVGFIKGMQGNDKKYLKVAACAKHFAVHSGPESLRHSFNALVSQKDLYETYLPAFKACVNAGVEVIMGAYNRVNDEVSCGNKFMLTDLLRGKWGFMGHVTSDCWAIKDFHEFHMVTNTPVESVALAMNAGCDLNCGNMYSNLLYAVRDGLVDEKTLDTAVERLVMTKMRLGIFDDPKLNPYSSIDYSVVDCDKHRKINLEASKRCLCLLKNEDNLLPLNLKKIKNIGIIGPNADNRRALVGNYEGTASEYVTIVNGIREYIGEKTRIYYSEGCHLFKDRMSSLGMENDRISEVKAVADKSDVIIACLGLDPSLEGEEGDEGNEFASGDKTSLNLPGLQNTVLETLYESGKPVILVLLSGSALSVTWADEHIPAIIQGWYPGAQGGRAIAQLLFGDYSPEGKLPVTFYRTTEELPEFTDYSMKNRTYRYMENEALYPFGYGLGYSKFDISDINVIKVSKGFDCSMKLNNRGNYDGRETVQIYIGANGLENAPKYQLKSLKKVLVKAGESKAVYIHLPKEAFYQIDDDGNEYLYEGKYSIFIGTGQPDKRTEKLTGKKPFSVEVTL